MLLQPPIPKFNPATNLALPKAIFTDTELK